MNKLELWLPVRNAINQLNLFGADPSYYQVLGQNGHPGVDFECQVGTPIYSPVEGDAFYTTDLDGGDGLWIRTPSNGAPQFNIILWHMPPKTDTAHWVLPTDGSMTHVKVGQLIGYTGNSGYPKESTGPHLHLGVMPCDKTGEAINPRNGFDGCVDPMLFLNTKFAQDYGLAEASLSTATAVIASPSLTPAQKVTTDKAIIAFIKRLFNWS